MEDAQPSAQLPLCYSPSLFAFFGCRDRCALRSFERGVLAALEDNGVGLLTSTDLPREEHQNIMVDRQHVQVGLSSNELSIGCAVPVNLRSRWNLALRNSLKLLPKIPGETGDVSTFVHDSLHKYDHMMAEFSLGYDAPEPGGC